MHLTRHTDYALRVLMYLTLQKGRLATNSEIAEAYDISRNHLVKIVHELGKCGLVRTVRGKSGGIELACAPAAITVGDVVRRMEENLEIVNCTTPSCPILPACAVRGVLGQARDAFLDVLDHYTIEDLVLHRERRLTRLLVS